MSIRKVDIAGTNVLTLVTICLHFLRQSCFVCFFKLSSRTKPRLHFSPFITITLFFMLERNKKVKIILTECFSKAVPLCFKWQKTGWRSDPHIAVFYWGTSQLFKRLKKGIDGFLICRTVYGFMVVFCIWFCVDWVDFIVWRISFWWGTVKIAIGIPIKLATVIMQ